MSLGQLSKKVESLSPISTVYVCLYVSLFHIGFFLQPKDMQLSRLYVPQPCALYYMEQAPCPVHRAQTHLCTIINLEAVFGVCPETWYGENTKILHMQSRDVRKNQPSCCSCQIPRSKYDLWEVLQNTTSPSSISKLKMGSDLKAKGGCTS